MPKLPLLYWDNDNIARIATAIGIPLWIDAYTSNWGRSSYARVCVKIDLSKPLPKGVWIPGLDGSFFQPIEYEGLSTLCFKCGMVGHRRDRCPLTVGSTAKVDNAKTGGTADGHTNVTKQQTAKGHGTENLNSTNSGECSKSNIIDKGKAPATTGDRVLHQTAEEPHLGGPEQPEGSWTLVQSRRDRRAAARRNTKEGNQPKQSSGNVKNTTKGAQQARRDPPKGPIFTPFNPLQVEAMPLGAKFNAGASSGSLFKHKMSKPNREAAMWKPRKRKKQGGDADDTFREEAFEDANSHLDQCGGDASPYGQ